MARMLSLALGLALLLGCREHGQQPLEPQMEASPPQFASIVHGFTELPTLGGNISRANAVNNHGQVVGATDDSSLLFRAFLWENGVMRELPAGSHASDINDLGQAVGFEHGAPGITHARLWPGAGVFALMSLGGSGANATGINDLGHAVGTSRNTSGHDRAVLWETSQVVQDLGTLGGTSSVARAINNLGQVVGESTTGSGETHAFLWENGVMQDLGTLGGPSSFATDINNLGQVVGASTNSSGQSRAFLWENGVMKDLGIFFSFANGINDLGQVVGFRKLLSTTDQFAFLWMDGTHYELGGFDAAEISNNGQVVGSHVNGTDQRGVIWDIPIRPPADLQPGDATNSVRLGSKGKNVAVAILSNPYFTAQEVNPASVTLGDEQGSDTPVVRDKRGRPVAVYRDIDRDGDTDLTLEFSKKEMMAKGDLPSSTTKLVLLGKRADGRPLRAVEPATVVP